MDLEGFWKLIEESRLRASGREEFLERLSARLRRQNPKDILAFDHHLDRLRSSAYRWDLWGAAYLMNGGCTDDGFEYFCAWLIAQGRETWELSLRDPDSLASFPSPNAELEELLYVARDAYEAKMGHELPPAPSAGRPRPDLGPGWNFDSPEEMKSRYPRLFAKYGE